MPLDLDPLTDKTSCHLSFDTTTIPLDSTLFDTLAPLATGSAPLRTIPHATARAARAARCRPYHHPLPSSPPTSPLPIPTPNQPSKTRHASPPALTDTHCPPRPIHPTSVQKVTAHSPAAADHQAEVTPLRPHGHPHRGSCLPHRPSLRLRCTFPKSCLRLPRRKGNIRPLP